MEGAAGNAPGPTTGRSSANMIRKTVAATMPIMMACLRCSGARPAAARLSPASTRSIITTCSNAARASAGDDFGHDRSLQARSKLHIVGEECQTDWKHPESHDRQEHAGADGDQPHARVRRRQMGAHISRDPGSLASALDKIDAASHEIENVRAEQNPATAHLFIINPLSGGAWTICSLLIHRPKTHGRLGATRCADGRGSVQSPPSLTAMALTLAL